MKRRIPILLLLAFFILSCGQQKDVRTIAPDILKDKIAGGWAGKVIGVTYGAPTEFHAQGKTFEDSISWVPADMKGSLWQDDIYVQITFLMTMDQAGIDAPAKLFQENFARAGFQLWHANVQARKNYFDSIFPPESGNPLYNMHADDIDFQIEADYIGFMCPGMPVTANKIGDKIGRIMNYGDGLYGGLFVAALYAEAFFENDIPKIIEHALLSIPAESDYAKIVRDVLLLHQHYPEDWRAAWKELEAKWGDVDICGAGSDFNIDAKLNGAYIVMGLLYGGGDPVKTMEISTRCGQDSDCNPSNAMAVLGVIKGLSALPENWKKELAILGDSNYVFTNYNFNKAVDRSFEYAKKLVVKEGGTVSDKEIRIMAQEPVAPVLEVSFPNLVTDKKISVFDSKNGWQLKGEWKEFQLDKHAQAEDVHHTCVSGKAGDEAIFTFTGTGVTFMGNWKKDGGKADVFVDGKLHRTIDTYFHYAEQEHHGINLWHVLNLPDGEHTVKLVVKGEKRPESSGTKIYLMDAIVFKTAPKKNDNFKFSFQP
ncbi:MAG: ADP-ribosylglycohydrolase family protein [Bacteroidales bacterium]